jgi:hypothetical protein
LKLERVPSLRIAGVLVLVVSVLAGAGVFGLTTAAKSLAIATTAA